MVRRRNLQFCCEVILASVTLVLRSLVRWKSIYRTRSFEIVRAPELDIPGSSTVKIEVSGDCLSFPYSIK